MHCFFHDSIECKAGPISLGTSVKLHLHRRLTIHSMASFYAGIYPGELLPRPYSEKKVFINDTVFRISESKMYSVVRCKIFFRESWCHWFIHVLHCCCFIHGYGYENQRTSVAWLFIKMSINNSYLSANTDNRSHHFQI